MILSCPSCGARFRIDAAKLGSGGRRVRCARCRHTWHAEPDGDQDAPAPTPEATDAPAADAGAESRVEQASRTETGAPAGPGGDDGVAFERPLRAGGGTPPKHGPDRDPGAAPGGRGIAAVGWILLLLVVAGLAAGLWQFRQQVVARVPQAAELYALAGIQVDGVGAGLALEDVARSRRLVDGESRLVIEGTVANTSNARRRVPMLEVTLYDAAGDAVASWRFSADAAELPAGGTTRFATTRDDPPDTARKVALTFVRDEG